MVYSLLIINNIFHKERSIPCQKKIHRLLIFAQNLLSKICAKLIEFLKDIITSPEFIARHRQSDTDFTRKRKMPFHLLIVFLLNALRGSYQDQLDRFFKILFQLDVADRVISKAALTKARMKLKYQAFVELNHHLNSFFEKNFTPKTWFDFRLLVWFVCLAVKILPNTLVYGGFARADHLPWLESPSFMIRSIKLPWMPSLNRNTSVSGNLPPNICSILCPRI